MTGTAQTTRAGGRRINGVDVARSFAMIGMLLVHTVIGAGTDMGAGGVPVLMRVLTPLSEFATGRAEALFVILAGLMVGMQARRAGDAPARRRLRVSLVRRGAVLFLIGLVLASTNGLVAQILTFYGAYFAVAALLLITLRPRTLMVLALCAAVTLPVVRTVAGLHGNLDVTATDVAAVSTDVAPGSPLPIPEGVTAEPTFVTPGWPWQRMLDTAVAAPRDILWAGYYPLLPEIAFFMFGMALAGLDLSARGAAARLAAGGLALVVGVPVLASSLGALAPHDRLATALFDVTPHSHHTAALLVGMASAVAALGVGLWAAARLPRATAPLRRLGTWSLTFYIWHIYAVILLAPHIGAALPLLAMPVSRPTQAWTALVLLCIPGVVVLAAAITRGRGPAEWLVRLAAAGRS